MLMARVLVPCWIQLYMSSWRNNQWCLGRSSSFPAMDDMKALDCTLSLFDSSVTSSLCLFVLSLGFQFHQVFIRKLLVRHSQSTVKYTKAQPRVEDAHRWHGIPVICQWTFRASWHLGCLGYCRQHCAMNTGAYILSNHYFLWYTPKRGIDVSYGFPGGSDGKESAYNVEDMGSIPGLGRSSGGGHGNPLKYSFLENPMDRGAWWATVHGVPKSQTWLSD